jgi:Flp pilus assembly protein TadB
MIDQLGKGMIVGSRSRIQMCSTLFKNPFAVCKSFPMTSGTTLDDALTHAQKLMKEKEELEKKIQDYESILRSVYCVYEAKCRHEDSVGR